MPTDESNRPGQQFVRPSENLSFGGTGIGDGCTRLKVRRNIAKEFLDRGNRRRQDNDIRVADRFGKIPFGAIHGADLLRVVLLLKIRVEAGDLQGRGACLAVCVGPPTQTEADGSTD